MDIGHGHHDITRTGQQLTLSPLEIHIDDLLGTPGLTTWTIGHNTT